MLVHKEAKLEIRIGVADSPKEISLEIKEDARGRDQAHRGLALPAATVLWLTDEKGKRVGVPSAKVAYVEIETETAPRIGRVSPVIS